MPTTMSAANLKQYNLVIFAGFRRQPKVIQSFLWKPNEYTQLLGLLKTDEGLEFTKSGLYFAPIAMKGQLFRHITTGEQPFFGDQENYYLRTIQDQVCNGWTFRLERIGILSNPNLGTSPEGSVANANPTVILWDQSHPHFPAWAKEPGHVFVVNDKASGSPSQRSLPWQIEIPAELIEEALAASNPEAPAN